MSPPRICATADPEPVTVWRMAGDDDFDLYIGPHITSLVEASGLSWPDFATKSGVAYSHLRNVASDAKPLTMKVALRLALALGMTLGQVLGQSAERPIRSGSIGAQGEIMPDASATMSGYFVLSESFPGLAEPGSLIQVIERDEWIVGRHLAIRFRDGRVRLREAVEHDGKRLLRDPIGDLVMYEPERHAVIGRVARVVRDLEE